MYRIVKIGADVHSSNFTLCAVSPILGEEPELLFRKQVAPDHKNILKFIDTLKNSYPNDEVLVTCGYEAGALGFTLHHQLEKHGVKCVIMAPSTMEMPGGKRIKTDPRDAYQIAKCLSNGGYHPVHVPTKEDEAVRDYIRMRDDHCKSWKQNKQQINSFCLRHGHIYDREKWTRLHLKWLDSLELSELNRETLVQYLLTYRYLEERIKYLEKRIEELAEEKAYREKVSRLCCFLGIRTRSALSLVVETGDFNRFTKASAYASFLGLVPGESSSADSINRMGITKAGNKQLRRLLIEASQSICKGKVGYKSKVLKARQKGSLPEVVGYADRANRRLRQKYYSMIYKGKSRNTCVTAIARELACFIWGMMTDNIA